MSKHLKMLLEQNAPAAEAPLPEAWGVLYARPNKDGTFKQCLNCVFYSLRQSCAIHEPEVVVPPDATCGYHVHGRPSSEPLKLGVLGPVPPELSGLQQVAGGSSCSRCRWFERSGAGRGICLAVLDQHGAPAMVEEKGCCARWEGSGQ